MADFNFDTEENTDIETVNEYSEEFNKERENFDSEEVLPIQKDEQTGVDYSDPNDVMVTISDLKTPLVILFGPPSCGKTMTLIRLSRYLKKEGYNIEPIRDFRPSNDKYFKEFCDAFPQMINSDEKPRATPNMAFMLVKVSRNGGDPICQILEAPGELYFDPTNTTREYPLYLDIINDSSNKKIFVFLLEPNWLDKPIRDAYVDRIEAYKENIDSNDRVIFLGNKVDTVKSFIKSKGIVNIDNFRDFLSAKDGNGGQYPRVFSLFKEKRPIISWFKPYDCEFVPFSTGTFKENGKFVNSNDNYPKMFWDKICKYIGRR